MYASAHAYLVPRKSQTYLVHNKQLVTRYLINIRYLLLFYPFLSMFSIHMLYLLTTYYT